MRRIRVGFASPPPVGLRLALDGQTYELTAIDLWAHWSADCAECGAPFETFCKPLALPGNRRCELHRAPGRRAAKPLPPSKEPE